MKNKLLLSLILLLSMSIRIIAQTSLWVGETYSCFIENYANKAYDWVNISWDVDYGLYKNYSGQYVYTVSFKEYTSGTKYVTAKWSETNLWDNSPFYHKSHEWSFTCKDNPILLEKNNLTMSVDETKSIGYSFTYDNSYTGNASISYRSSNNNVATVDYRGVVTAKAEGTATITVSSSISKDTKSCSITVESGIIKVTNISILGNSSAPLVVGDKRQLTADVSPSNATDKTVTWSSSNANVAIVSNSGLVTAKAAGNTTITCKANDGSGKLATCSITVNLPMTEINATNFPDDNFRNYLLEQDYGKDGKLTEEEIKNITSLNVSSKSIRSLQGVEYLTALTTLWCYSNQLTALDVSRNIALTDLRCYSNQLTTLDISKNIALKSLSLGGNQLTALDVSRNTALTRLTFGGNQLRALDVSKNTTLQYLDCSSNQLRALDVSKNTALTTLYCDNNQLTALDVSKNTALIDLDCYSNQLTALDVSKNTALIDLDCYSNQLTALDVSKNTALTWLYCYDNQIKGASMDNLIKSLPICYDYPWGKLRVYSSVSSDEGNVCTKEQVKAAKEKGWTVYYERDEYDWQEYEGSDDTSSVADDIRIDASEDAPVYNLRGQRLTAPQKGVNIIGGRKVVVK